MAIRKACLITFGCQMNVYDSGRLASLLKGAGWEMTKNREEADFIFFNTCSIREKAAQRVLNHLEGVRSLKKRRPGLIIGVGGCVAEQEGEKLRQDLPWLDLVVGPQRLPEIPRLLENLEEKTLTGPGRRPAWSRENLADLGAAPFANRAAANGLVDFVAIMQGCDNYCAYCVVPFLRGPELSRQADDVLDEVKRLVDGGARDVTLLGQNVNAYGKGLAGAPSFPQLLEKVAATGLERLRFTTSHPKDFSPELARLFGSLPALCEALHLPVQSGSDKILKAMGRVYTRDSYLRLVEELRANCPSLALYTDVIVGFPGETEKDFEETLSLMDIVGYDAMFSFKYSDRPQTASINFENKIPEEEKGRRLEYLQSRQKAVTLAKNKAHIGEIMEILVERESERYAGQLTGRARNFKIVHFDGPPTLIGQTVPVRVAEAWAASLRGVRPAN